MLAELAIDLPVDAVFGVDAALLSDLVAGLIAVLALSSAVLELAGSRYAREVARFTVSLVIGAFVLPLAAEPLIAGPVIAWALYNFGRMIFDPGERPLSARSARTEDAADSAAEHGPALRHLLGVSLFATVCVVGYGFEQRLPAFVLAATFGLLAIAAGYRVVLARLRRWDWAAIAVVVLTIAGVFALGVPRLGLTLLLAAQVLLLSMARHERFVGDLFEGLYERPAALVVTSFLALIFLGTVLLSFPAASSSGRSIGLLDALFTATSASCVTGLIVLDTASDFSVMGQAVILLLLQAGGLNIMVLSTFAALLLGRGLGLRGERALGDVLDIGTPGAAYQLIAFIIKVTVAVELAGAIGMAWAYARHDYTWGSAAWNGLFQAVSAFCNAGFALQSDSLIMFRGEPFPLLLMAALITLGGLGFAVLSFSWQRLRRRATGHLAAQSRIVLIASAILVVAGFVAYLAVEWSASLAGMSLADKLVNALFQSVTLRTAGFNSVSFESLQPVTALWMMAFMFIGASPGGTGGGIKTTTAVVLFAAIPAFLRRRPNVVLGERAITAQVLHQSASIAVVSASVVLFGGLLLMASQVMPFEVLLFEAFSAFGTVGLSLGATAQLDAFGKTVIILMMLIGRVGPLAVTLLLAREYPSRVTYPEARLMVG